MGTFSTTTSAVADPYGFNPQFNWIDSGTATTPGSICDLGGHEVAEWAEYLDGRCVGVCTRCMGRVSATRMPGGMPFMRLKALVEQLIAMPDSAELFLEINEVTEILEAEGRALEDARALLRTARAMAGCDES